MKVEEILRVSDQGVSRPYVCRDDAGRVRWCKGNHTGVRAVICEWMCACIAGVLGLPVPEPAILRVDVGAFRKWCRMRAGELPQLVTDANPFVFGSLNVENAKDVFNPAAELSHVDRNLLARIYMFDALIRNTDRTDANSNLLVNGSVYVIDHNNAFDPEFSPDDFAGGHILRKSFAECDGRLCAEFRDQVVSLVTDAFLDAVWSEMPEAWTDLGEELIPLERIKAVLRSFAL